MMRLLLITLMLPLLGKAQLSPAQFSFSAEKQKDNSYTISIRAVMEKGWHIYPLSEPKDAIAMPTKITVNKNPLVVPVGAIKEKGTRKKQVLKELGITQYYFADSVVFQQSLRLKAKVRTAVSGTITYMVCTDEMCLPAKTIPFNIKLD